MTGQFCLAVGFFLVIFTSLLISLTGKIASVRRWMRRVMIASVILSVFWLGDLALWRIGQRTIVAYAVEIHIPDEALKKWLSAREGKVIDLYPDSVFEADAVQGLVADKRELGHMVCRTFSSDKFSDYFHQHSTMPLEVFEAFIGKTYVTESITWQVTQGEYTNETGVAMFPAYSIDRSGNRAMSSIVIRSSSDLQLLEYLTKCAKSHIWNFYSYESRQCGFPAAFQESDITVSVHPVSLASIHGRGWFIAVMKEPSDSCIDGSCQ